MSYRLHSISRQYTAIPYWASTGPEQGFPCVVFPHREKPVFIAGFPVENTTQGKPCFHYRDGFAVQEKHCQISERFLRSTP